MEPFFKKFYGWLNEISEPSLAAITPPAITPNIVTLFRAFLAIPVFALLLAGFKTAAIAIYIVAGILDYFDGALARGRNSVTDLGKFLDPIADKVFFALLVLPLSLVVFFTNDLTYASAFLMAMASSSVVLETLIAAVRADDYSYNKGLNGRNNGSSRELKANYSGKIKFNLQLFALGFLILAYPAVNGPAIWTSVALFAVSLPFACLSYIHKDKNSRPM